MISILNPEAPEFYPNLASVTQTGCQKVNKSTKLANNITAGTSNGYSKDNVELEKVTSSLSENVSKQLKNVANNPAVTLKRQNHEYFIETVVDLNDASLDRINNNIQDATLRKSLDDAMSIPLDIAKSSIFNIPSGLQGIPGKHLGDNNILRPQLHFKDVIDNSTNIWVPKIKEKPNSIVPLALKLVYDGTGDATGYEHPYKSELEMFDPAQFLEPDLESFPFPLSLEDTQLTYVDTEAALDQLINHLMLVKELAVDVEHHSYRTYLGITCLIQITTHEGGDFIIDTINIREHIYKLNVIFTNPNILKVFHGADNDVLWLQRDFGLYIVGMFDTHRASKLLLHVFSLKYILYHYCNVCVDKSLQLSDWRKRPLDQDLINYARSDTHYLLYVWHTMKAQLLEKASGQKNLLHGVFINSREVCSRTYSKDVITKNSYMKLYLESKKDFNSQQLAAFEILYNYRDEQARLLDESTTYLLPNTMLLAIAEALPREVQGIMACHSPVPPFVHQNLVVIHNIMLTCRELPTEPQLYQMPTGIRNMINDTHTSMSYNVHDMSQYFEDSEDYNINLDQAAQLLEEFKVSQPDIDIFLPAYNSDTNFVSNLNADAKLFIPPYDRYRKYRFLAQMEEMKEFKDKETKITAYGKGNELVKKEVLAKLQEAKNQIANDDKVNIAETTSNVNTVENVTYNKVVHRKRKISADKSEQKVPDQIVENNHQDTALPKPKDKPDSNVKSFHYKNVNYKKFFDDNQKERKQPKMKSKKIKK